MDEFGFIDTIARAFEGMGDGRMTGIGDDCAVIPYGCGSESLVVTVDMLIEGVHFLRGATTARELGSKALAVNLSDVAAMGARPVASLMSVALPTECRGEWALEFVDGYREMSERFGVRLIGGDTTSSVAGVAINVTAIGRAPDGNLKYRIGAMPGDLVVVSGRLGESAAGLRDILEGRLDTPAARTHRNPIPQVAEGEWLGAWQCVHSMMDLSDGLASDLVHILRASSIKNGVEIGAQICLDAIPTSVGAELAVTGGEDYKLLFTVDPNEYPRMAEEYGTRFGSELYAVGRIVVGSSDIAWMENGSQTDHSWRGFMHF